MEQQYNFILFLLDTSDYVDPYRVYVKTSDISNLNTVTFTHGRDLSERSGLVQYRASVSDDGTISNQQWVNISCLLGVYSLSILYLLCHAAICDLPPIDSLVLQTGRNISHHKLKALVCEVPQSYLKYAQSWETKCITPCKVTEKMGMWSLEQRAFHWFIRKQFQQPPAKLMPSILS